MSSRARHRSKGSFRRRGALQGWSLHFGPNMTPMVDVVMVILIFFMASAAFGGREWFLAAAIPNIGGMGARPPKPVEAGKLPPVRLDLVLERDADGRTVVTFLDLSRASLEQFEKRLLSLPNEQVNDDIEIIVKPRPDVPYPDVVRVHESCKARGIWKVALGVKK